MVFCHAHSNAGARVAIRIYRRAFLKNPCLIVKRSFAQVFVSQLKIMSRAAIQKSVSREGSDFYIYIAGPWAPMGGGMFRVADYLIQAQRVFPTETAELRPLDTRGGGTSVASLWVLAKALVKIMQGRFSGNLVGVHVNVAERLSLFRKGAIVVLCRILGIPVVLHLHAAKLPYFYRKMPGILQGLTRWIFSLPASCLVLGDNARQFVVQELMVPADQVEVIINGVPEPIYVRRTFEGKAARQVLFVGNLSERKGVSDFLQALALLKSENLCMQVTLAGGGDLLFYQTVAQQLGVNTLVNFMGWTDQQKVAELMALADVLILPSYDEGLPLVILEALANGVAVICAPVGEIPSLLTHSVNASFVQAGDVSGIAQSLQKVLLNFEYRRALEINGRALYEQRFSLVKFSANVAVIHQRHFGKVLQPSEQSFSARSPPS